MTKIFISYRRIDSQYITDTIYEHMLKHFGKENVFIDVDHIPIGIDFRKYLRKQVLMCDVILVIIGPDWEKIMADHIDQKEDDFVRIEIESALENDKLIIPVLVKNAEMPNFENLPESIQDLQWRNQAIIRRNPDLENDCLRLVNGIRQQLDMPKPKQAISIKWIEIPNKGYSIAKYPITNEQYQLFIDADGYNHKKWWTQKGWEAKVGGMSYHFGKNYGRFAEPDYYNISGISWSSPSIWQSNDYMRRNNPVVGVSWYEAIAFCLWLSNTTKIKITLPTIKQWQYAAQSQYNNKFPWGNKWDCTRCNNSVNPCKSNGFSTVHKYEKMGDSRFGVVDMVGNAQEWSLTSNNLIFNKNNMNSNATGRFLMGASWKNNQPSDFLCKASIKWSHPTTRGYEYGFRVVVNI